MYTNCAKIFRLTVPAVKATVARDLTLKHRLSEKRIAKSLGIAQPAISKYLNGKYSREAGLFEDLIRSNPSYRRIITAVVSDKNPHEISQMIDRVAAERRVVKKAMSVA